MFDGDEKASHKHRHQNGRPYQGFEHPTHALLQQSLSNRRQVCACHVEPSLNRRHHGTGPGLQGMASLLELSRMGYEGNFRVASFRQVVPHDLVDFA